MSIGYGCLALKKGVCIYFRNKDTVSFLLLPFHLCLQRKPPILLDDGLYWKILAGCQDLLSEWKFNINKLFDNGYRAIINSNTWLVRTLVLYSPCYRK